MVSRHLPVKRMVKLALAVTLAPGLGCGGSGSVAEPTEISAVDALLEAADTAEREGRLDEAAAAIERALRLEPSAPALWTRLARVRLAEGLPEQAESLALKATTLSGGDGAEVRDAWAVVAEARTALGDPQGAAVARDRAGRAP